MENLAKIFALMLVASSLSFSAERNVFPHKMPTQKPNYPLSEAIDRMFNYPAPRVQDNEFYTTFKYTRLEGLDYHGGDGTVSRRDPSRPIYVNGKYYMWYTKRDTKFSPIGAARANEATSEIPSTDWDLCDIWYATSDDGFTWKEQGIAVKRPSAPTVGWRSIATPDILVWKGKYYLYFQAFNEPSGLRGDWCQVAAAYADSPDGPWTYYDKPVIPVGQKGDWDQDQVQDPHPIVYKGKIYVYYKAAFNKWPDIRNKYAVAHGVVIASNPLGPFERPALNPVMNTGHETMYFPYKEGIATLAIRDGNERETIQWSPDGINFRPMCVVSLAPTAAGAFTPDAFTDTKYGRGITWGVCHFTNASKNHSAPYSIIARFDCDLSLDCNDPAFKQTSIFLPPEAYFSQSLGVLKKVRQEAGRNGK